ncbi:MAG: hypothetical protein C5B55_12295 [Blastocatellia bacterium]|nr:MAG: hypothetical protein C5B55_12295 [Blastocatellia bacterium]
MMKRLVLSCLALGFVLVVLPSSALAQTETAAGVETSTDVALLRRNLRAEKKQLIALNLTLTEVEATKFWPVYDQYALEMGKLNDEFDGLIKNYAANQKTLTDEQADKMIRRWAEIQVQLTQTRQKYIPIVEKVISPRKASLFFQIDRRLYALMDLQISSQLPLLVQ